MFVQHVDLNRPLSHGQTFHFRRLVTIIISSKARTKGVSSRLIARGDCTRVLCVFSLHLGLLPASPLSFCVCVCVCVCAYVCVQVTGCVSAAGAVLGRGGYVCMLPWTCADRVFLLTDYYLPRR